MLLMYKYLQSFYYISVKSDALNPTLSIERFVQTFAITLFFRIKQSLRAVILDTTFYGFEFPTRMTRV